MTETLTIHYHRPPDRVDVYVQDILYADKHVLVSFLRSARVRKPLLIGGEVAIEPGSPLIWFTFPGAMHDVGLFHTAQGDYTGCYSDILEPVEVTAGREIVLTDLFLDIWIGRDGKAVVLDADELAAAVKQRWVSRETGERAWAEANRLLELHEKGEWPPPVVNEWNLARVNQKNFNRRDS